MNYNFCLQIGHITRDIQLSYLPNQTPVIEFGIANNRKWTQDGQKREDAMFIGCRAYGKTAENIHKYFTKGKPILVEGRLQLDQWTDKQGQKRSKHRLVVNRFEFVPSQTPQDAPQATNAPPPVAQPPPMPEPPVGSHDPAKLNYPAEPNDPNQLYGGTGDDIPFEVNDVL